VDAIETHDDMWDLMAKFQLWSIPTFISMSVAADEVRFSAMTCLDRYILRARPNKKKKTMSVAADEVKDEPLLCMWCICASI